MTSLPRMGVHRLYAKETRARKQITFEENGSLNNFPPLGCQCNNQWRQLLINIPCLQQISMTWIKNSFSMVEWLNKTCLAYCTRLAELFQTIRNKNSQNISTGLARHHLQRFSASDAAASTQCNAYASWIGITLALLKQCLICIQIFSLLFFNVNMKTASVQQEAASAVTSVDTYTFKKTYIEHSCCAPYWCLHSVVFNLCLIIQNHGIWKIGSFYCFIRLGFSFRTPYRLYH